MTNDQPTIHILLINVHSARNAGDAVLNEAAVAQLQAYFPHATITLAMNDPESASLLHAQGVQAVGAFLYWAKQRGRGRTGWDWRTLPHLLWESWHFVRRPRSSGAPWANLLEAYATADLVISCPGNFLYSSGRIGLPFLLSIYTLAVAIWLGKPVYMMPQTIGPLARGWERALVGWVLRHLRLAFVRDALSQELVRQLAPTAAVHLAPDVAFAFPTPELAPAQRLLASHGVQGGQTPCLGVTLINWGAQKRHFGQQAQYEAAVTAAIRAFVAETGGQVVLFSQVQGPQTADDDRIPAQRVFAQLGDLGGRVIFLPQEIPPHTLKAAYSQMDLFLGSRLHSNIFALSSGVPVVAIQYQYKTRGIMEMLGMGQWVLPIETATEHNLPPLLLAAWNQRTALRTHLQAVLPPLVQEVSAVGRAIQQDYAHWATHPALK